MGRAPFTPYPDVNGLLQQVLEEAQRLLGSEFVAMYLDGSLANGGFDADSDIDFVIVAEQEITGARFLVLQAMHDRLAALDTPWAIQLEGSYLSRRAIRQYDPACARHPNIERGLGERLKMVDHGPDWDIHRFILRERGITLVGPPPHTLVDPVQPDRLRQAMLSLLSGWARGILDRPEQVRGRGYQSYIVLSMCRVLYTLEHGAVVSKPAAARWAQMSLGEPYASLIDRAWTGRSHSDQAVDSGEMAETLSLIEFVIDRGLTNLKF